MPTGTPTGWRRSLLAALACADVADAVEFFVELADAQSVRRLALADIAGHGSVNSVGSIRPAPPGVWSMAICARTPSRPTMRSTQSPATAASSCTSSQSSTKNSTASARSGTTMSAWSSPLDRHVLDGRTRKARGNASAITGPNARSTGVARLRNTLTRRCRIRTLLRDSTRWPQGFGSWRTRSSVRQAGRQQTSATGAGDHRCGPEAGGAPRHPRQTAIARPEDLRGCPHPCLTSAATHK